MTSSNVNRQPGFTQVCVWPGTLLNSGEADIQDFTDFFLNEMGVRIQYLEQIETNPTPGQETTTGGRNDVFFALHNDDIDKFVIPKLKLGIRWIEDVYFNENGYLYPDRIRGYCNPH